tara:strand:- start:3344 stop:4828 length:1485 start_codon:yes stop_codon:yes gene_type:complete
MRAALFTIFLSLSVVHAATLHKIADIPFPKGSAEIIAYSVATGELISTRQHGKHASLQVLKLPAGADPKTLSLDDRYSISSVATHPEKPLAAATLIPFKPLEAQGEVVLVDLQTEAEIARYPVGYHPDCVNFSKDGRLILVACEGEFGNSKLQTPGSLSVIEWERGFAADYHLPVPAPGGTALRAPHGNGWMDLEPEYVSESNGIAYLTLQENNAIARFNLASRQWLPVWELGSWSITGDFSDRDGPWGETSIQSHVPIHAMPQPDTLTTLVIGGRTFVATANEGENAGGTRVKHLGLKGPTLDREYRRELKKKYGIHPQHDMALGRLQVSPIEGDLDGDGDIDELVAFGTRSFSIWDGETGERVFDSGQTFEAQGSTRAGTHNWDLARADRMDSRSDNRGPEPEAIASGLISGHPYLAVATERQGSIYLYQVETAAAPKLVAIIDEGVESGLYSPESLLFLPENSNPYNAPVLVCGWEGSERVTFYKILPNQP